MSRIRPRELRIRNFGAIETAVFSLADRGLVLIRGDNRDTEAADSNGSGKSTLFGALFWVLFGESITRGRTVDVIRRGAKKAHVEFDFEDDDHTYTVTRMRTPTSSTLELRTDGEPTSERTARDTEERIVEILGLDALSFRSTVLFGQGDLLRFAEPGVTDTQRKDVLKEILRLDRFDGALKRVRARLKELEGDRREALDARARVEAVVETVERQIADTRTRRDAWERTQATKLSELRDEVDALAKPSPADRKLAAELSRLEGLEPASRARANELAADATAANEAAQAATLAAERADAAVRAAAAEARRRQTELDRVGRDLEKLDPSKDCPICVRPLADSDHFAKHRADLELDVIDADRANAYAHAELAAREEAARTAASAKAATAAELRAARASRDEWSEKADTLAERLKAARAARGRIDILDERRAGAERRLQEAIATTNPHAAPLAKVEGQHATAGADLERCGRALDTVDAKVAPLTFWAEAFGNRGLPSLAMDAAMPLITQAANGYLGTLADGDITVQVSTERALKDGGSKDEIAIVPTVEGFEGVEPSGGQRRKVTLAVALALADLVATREGSQVDLLLLDEVLDGLDSEGRARVVELLRGLREERSSIFVISHDPGVAENFEKVITVVKEGGKAVLVDDTVEGT